MQIKSLRPKSDFVNKITMSIKQELRGCVESKRSRFFVAFTRILSESEKGASFAKQSAPLIEALVVACRPNVASQFTLANFALFRAFGHRESKKRHFPTRFRDLRTSAIFRQSLHILSSTNRRKLGKSRVFYPPQAIKLDCRSWFESCRITSLFEFAWKN